MRCLPAAGPLNLGARTSRQKKPSVPMFAGAKNVLSINMASDDDDAPPSAATEDRSPCAHQDELRFQRGSAPGVYWPFCVIPWGGCRRCVGARVFESGHSLSRCERRISTTCTALPNESVHVLRFTSLFRAILGVLRHQKTKEPYRRRRPPK